MPVSFFLPDLLSSGFLKEGSNLSDIWSYAILQLVNDNESKNAGREIKQMLEEDVFF